MAVAEARAAWQRTANRCFVQEDAKRAPKLACCQPSSSVKQIDSGPTNAADMPENAGPGFMPLHRNSSYSNLPPDTRWWLQLQPSYGYQKGFTCEQLNVLEAEMEILRTEIVNLPSKTGEVRLNDDTRSDSFDGSEKHESSFGLRCRISADCRNKDPDGKNNEARALNEKNAQECEPKDTKGISKLMDMDPFECFRLQKSDDYCFDSESPFIGGEEDVPWWQITDKDDLASLVAQKSLDYIANCDLPPPQKMHIRRYPNGYAGSSDHDDILSSSSDRKAQSGCVSSPIVHAHGCPSSESLDKRHSASLEGQSPSGFNRPHSYTASYKAMTEIGQLPEGDPCKAELLEALRHSQTRAREAEKVAKQACADKEHIVKLFFRQASQLFAYKQWFQLLQLETLYYQVKNSEQPISTLFPVALPWMPQKGRKLRKNWQKSSRSKRGKRGRVGPDVSKYALALALGLGLVGAGLLLGWTVGWMLPI